MYEKLEEIGTSMVNGQMEQAKRQIKKYGIRNFMNDYPCFIDAIENDAMKKYSRIKSVINLIYN